MNRMQNIISNNQMKAFAAHSLKTKNVLRISPPSLSSSVKSRIPFTKSKSNNNSPQSQKLWAVNYKICSSEPAKRFARHIRVGNNIRSIFPSGGGVRRSRWVVILCNSFSTNKFAN